MNRFFKSGSTITKNNDSQDDIDSMSDDDSASDGIVNDIVDNHWNDHNMSDSPHDDRDSHHDDRNVHDNDDIINTSDIEDDDIQSSPRKTSYNNNSEEDGHDSIDESNGLKKRKRTKTSNVKIKKAQTTSEANTKKAKNVKRTLKKISNAKKSSKDIDAPYGLTKAGKPRKPPRKKKRHIHSQHGIHNLMIPSRKNRVSLLKKTDTSYSVSTVIRYLIL